MLKWNPPCFHWHATLPGLKDLISFLQLIGSLRTWTPLKSIDYWTGSNILNNYSTHHTIGLGYDGHPSLTLNVNSLRTSDIYAFVDWDVISSGGGGVIACLHKSITPNQENSICWVLLIYDNLDTSSQRLQMSWCQTGAWPSATTMLNLTLTRLSNESCCSTLISHWCHSNRFENAFVKIGWSEKSICCFLVLQ